MRNVLVALVAFTVVAPSELAALAPTQFNPLVVESLRRQYGLDLKDPTLCYFADTLEFIYQDPQGDPADPNFGNWVFVWADPVFDMSSPGEPISGYIVTLKKVPTTSDVHAIQVDDTHLTKPEFETWLQETEACE